MIHFVFLIFKAWSPQKKKTTKYYNFDTHTLFTHLSRLNLKSFCLCQLSFVFFARNCFRSDKINMWAFSFEHWIKDDRFISFRTPTTKTPYYTHYKHTHTHASTFKRHLYFSILIDNNLCTSLKLKLVLWLKVSMRWCISFIHCLNDFFFKF